MSKKLSIKTIQLLRQIIVTLAGTSISSFCTWHIAMQWGFNSFITQLMFFLLLSGFILGITAIFIIVASK